ncbi:MAG TPA: GspH/FimT family pseudopilin [Candidatus Methylomirabilis sp.]|nr:GspH/FimT family pseudopilin [Candidatus Methylomirabilis sp.]
MKKSQAGFSTIELIVVIVIIGFVAITSAPYWQDVLDALTVNKAKGAAEQVQAAIEQTRAYGILESATYRIRFPGNNTFQIDCVQSCSTSPPTEGPLPLVNNATVTPQGGVDPVCNGDWCIWFNSIGTSSGGDVQVRYGSEQRTVQVSFAGRVRIQ